MLGVNVNDYLAAPCRCAWCRERYGNDLALRYAPRRTWTQFLMFYESLLNWRGSYTQALYLNDPDVIEAQASAKDEDWKVGKPGLWQWSKEMDALYFIADQVQAGRIRNPDDFRPFVRPVIPSEIVRKRRKEMAQDSGIEAAMARGEAMVMPRLS